MKLETILAPINADMQAVDQTIHNWLDSDVILIRQLANYIINSGGKRLRPAVVLLAARACGCRGSDHVLLAATVEFIHTATLLHDDVVDVSDMRRGRDTANALWGNSASVLTGDFLYSRAFQMMVALERMPVMEVLADATNRIAEGEVMQLMNAHNPDLTEAAYLEVIDRKTASLFAAGCRLGALLAGADSSMQGNLDSYGRKLGVAFQITDDALDYGAAGDQIGKNIGDDLAEGKATLPLITALQRTSAQTAAQIGTAIADGNIAQLGVIQKTIESTQAMQYTCGRAQDEASAAISALSALPDSPCKTALTQLAEFAVERSY